MTTTKNTESLSIIVQWDKVDNSLITTYIVTWTNERDHMISHFTLEEQSSYMITGLTLDTVYTITVTASNKCGTGPEYSTSVLFTNTSSNTSTITAITNTMAITSIASSSTSTAIAKSNTITITTTTAVMNPSTAATNPITTSSITDLKTSSTTPNAFITSTYTTTDHISPASTVNPNNASTADENSKILTISICN